MQTAMNPLLLSLGLGASSDPAISLGQDGLVPQHALAGDAPFSLKSFAELMAAVPAAPAAKAIELPDGIATGSGQGPIAQIIETASGVLARLTEFAESADLPPELAENLQGAIDALGQFVERLQSGEAFGQGDNPLAALIELPEIGGEILASLPQIPQELRLNLQAVVQELELVLPNLPAAAAGAPGQALAQIVSEVQQVFRPTNNAANSALHPVALTPDLQSQSAQSKSPNAVPVQAGAANPLLQGALPGAAEGVVDLAKAPELTLGGAPQDIPMKSEAALSIAQIAQSAQAKAAQQATPGAIDIPREMIQVVPQEAVNIVQPASELAPELKAVEAAQQARPETTQAKFTQAVVGQLRAVEFKEGTTKVELNPRGLGQIEVEMKTNSDGSLSVVVRAESAHVLNSLRSESDLLAQVIGQSGEGSVDFQEFSSEQEQSFAEGDQGGSSDGAAGGEGDVETGTTTNTQTIGNGQLDLTT